MLHNGWVPLAYLSDNYQYVSKLNYSLLENLWKSSEIPDIRKFLQIYFFAEKWVFLSLRVAVIRSHKFQIHSGKNFTFSRKLKKNEEFFKKFLTKRDRGLF